MVLLIHQALKLQDEPKIRASMGEKTEGRKRHIVVDIMGNLLSVVVHAADIHYIKAGIFVAEKAI